MPCLYPHHRNLQKNNDGNQNIGADKYSFLDIPIPPLQEQKAIAHYIETECDRIDAKIVKTKRIIELQKEYRTALISEAVTGKIKVPQLT